MAEENSNKNIDIFNFAISSNLNNFSSKKKTLKRETGVGRSNHCRPRRRH